MTGDFREILTGEHRLGFELVLGGTVFFFGTRDVTAEMLQSHYVEFKFHSLKQVHGNRLVEVSSTPEEADAHWTEQSKTALRISTADCLPVLIANPNFICAIHAGWRGIHNGIIPNSLAELFKRFAGIDRTWVAVGPHIRRDSFEVEEALGFEIQTQAQRQFSCGEVISSSSNKGRVMVDLNRIAEAQLKSMGIEHDRIIVLPLDTMTDQRLHSYRREKAAGTRNYSFIARL